MRRRSIESASKNTWLTVMPYDGYKQSIIIIIIISIFVSLMFSNLTSDIVTTYMVFTILQENKQKKLSYRKQIARKLRTQYDEGIYLYSLWSAF